MAAAFIPLLDPFDTSDHMGGTGVHRQIDLGGVEVLVTDAQRVHNAARDAAGPKAICGFRPSGGILI